MHAAGWTVLLLGVSLCLPCSGQVFARMPEASAAQSAQKADSAIEGSNQSQRASEATVADAAQGLIRLDVTVTDKAGKPVAGLGAGDFTLLDNGHPTKLVSFHAHDGSSAGPDPETEVIVVIDAVNLSPQQVTTGRRELEKFLRANSGQLAQPTVIYRLSGFGLSGSGLPTRDGNALAAEVARGKDMQAVWQHSARAIEPLLSADYARARNAFSLAALGSIAIEERRRPGRKLLLWIGPGWPVKAGGEYMLDEIVEMSTRLREARIAVFTVTAWAYPEMEFSYENFLKHATSDKDTSSFDLQLEVLAIESGGQVMEPSFDLAGSMQKVIGGQNRFYALGFDPPRTSMVDEYHELKAVVDRPGVTVRTESGYFDQPVIYDQPPVQERVTLAGLEQALKNAHGRSDDEVVRQLNRLELTERMSSEELARWTEQMPGGKSRAALTVVADEGAFLEPPQDALVRDAAPDLAAQKQMIARTVGYLATIIPKLPDFFATRTTVRFEEPKQKDEETWKTVLGEQTLHPAATTRVTMHMRGGKEEADSGLKRAKGRRGRERDLVTEGTFGPILSTVMLGAVAPHSQMTWSHWERGERGERGREAVFKFAVSEETPLFEVGFCCLADPDGTVYFQKKSGFHGEIAIEPQTGAILRIQVEADLQARLPLNRSAVMVEYGPVSIGDKEYICPTRSVSIARSRTVRTLHQWHESFGVYGPFETMVNDVRFSDYHIFRSTSRILIGMDPAQ